MKPIPESKKTKECPHCFTEIDIRATICPNCRSELVHIKKRTPAKNTFIYQMGSLSIIVGVAGLMFAVLLMFIGGFGESAVFSLLCGGPGLLILFGGIFVRAFAEVILDSRRNQLIFFGIMLVGLMVVFCFIALLIPGLLESGLLTP